MQIDLHALLNLPELAITSVEMTDRKLVIHCHSRLGEAICPSCLRPTREVKKYYRRAIRDLSITGRAVYLNLEERQFFCFDCTRYFTERFSFVEPNRTTTTRYEAYLYERCEKTPIKQVAIQEDLCWAVVQDIYERQAKRNMESVDTVRWLGIDELALRKGHKSFVCVLVDLERACVIDLLPDRKKAYLLAYFRKKGKAFCEQIEVFSCDMWDGFLNTARTLMPNAEIVVDRFHVMGQIHQALDKYRRALRRADPMAEVLKRLKWVLFKHPQDLTEEETTRLEQAFEAFPQLEQVWQLKEDLYLWFETFDQPQLADCWLSSWIEQAHSLNIRYLDTFVDTLQRWRKYIVAFFQYRITNGMVEGINNLIKAIKRMAYGFRNFDHFRLRVLFECRG
jgi:transposase